MINSAAAIFLGAYLILVSVRGNASTLIATLPQDKGFIKWGAAMLVLYALANNDATKTWAKPLIGLTLATLLISSSSNPTVANGIKWITDFFAKVELPPKP
jgi:hypothetical protein